MVRDRWREDPREEYEGRRPHRDSYEDRDNFEEAYRYGRGDRYANDMPDWGIPGAQGTRSDDYHGGGLFGTQGRQGRNYDYGREGYGRSGRDERGFWDKASDEVSSWMGNEDAERRRQRDRNESHYGRGPQGYARSDERISDDVHDRLTDDWRLDASSINVSVEGREVTLEGTVSSRADKRRAEDIVEDISGVTHVQNNLRVKPLGAEPVTDFSSSRE